MSLEGFHYPDVLETGVDRWGREKCFVLVGFAVGGMALASRTFLHNYPVAFALGCGVVIVVTIMKSIRILRGVR